MEIAKIIEWIEAHPVTMSIVEWAAIIFLAWATGLFKLIRQFTKKPKVKIIKSASKCLIEKYDENDGNKDVIRASFLIDISVVNPTKEQIVIESFYLSYFNRAGWKHKSKLLHAVTIPCRPRQEMGGGVKLSKVFFSNYEDNMDELTMNGVIPAREFQNGYLLFVSYTFGTFNPMIKDKNVKIIIKTNLTTGESLKDTQNIRVTEDKEGMEKIVPGLNEHISHEAAWNHFVE